LCDSVIEVSNGGIEHYSSIRQRPEESSGIVAEDSIAENKEVVGVLKIGKNSVAMGERSPKVRTEGEIPRFPRGEKAGCRIREGDLEAARTEYRPIDGYLDNRREKHQISSQ
jgi:hypothetical protein